MMRSIEMSLSIKGLTKQFTQKNNTPVTVLDQIELTIEKGEFVSLLGPSGCGKSTLLSLIAGLQQPTKGTIQLGETLVKKPSPDKGVVFQEAALFPWLNVWEKDRKSTRLNSSHVAISYAVFCLKKNTTQT